MARVRVSILLPIRDADRTLVECLRSLRHQRLEDYEILAVDDGSRDQSPAILRAFAFLDRRLRILHTPRLGIAPALNTACAAARGEFVARMDADDVAHPERLSLQVRTLQEGGDILGCRVRLLSEVGRLNQGMERYVAWQNSLLDHDSIVRDLLVESPLAHPSILMRRQTLVDLGAYRVFDGPEDYDLWLRARARGLRFAKVPAHLVLWRDLPDRLSRRDPRYGPDRFLRLKLDALEAPLRASRGAVIWGAGPIGKTWARALQERGHRVRAFVEVDPRKIGQWIHGAIVLPVDQARVEGALHLAAVGRAGARELIRGEATRLGIREGRELIAVA